MSTVYLCMLHPGVSVATTSGNTTNQFDHLRCTTQLSTTKTCQFFPISCSPTQDPAHTRPRPHKTPPTHGPAHTRPRPHMTPPIHDPAHASHHPRRTLHGHNIPRRLLELTCQCSSHLGWISNAPRISTEEGASTTTIIITSRIYTGFSLSYRRQRFS